MSARSYNEQGTAKRAGRDEWGQFDGTTIRPNAAERIEVLENRIQLRTEMLANAAVTGYLAQRLQDEVDVMRAELDKLTEQDERRAVA